MARTQGGQTVDRAWAIVLTGAAISWGRFVGYVPTSHWTLWSGRLGIWIEAILLSLALADQINILRQEKDQATQRERETILLAKHELESKVTERTLDLQAAKQKADAANQTKSLFLANISHEIRTPMNAIIGSTNLILKTPITERQQKYLLIMQNAAHMLLHMINDILDFSKSEAGELKIERIPFHLHTLIEETLRLMEGRADEKGLEFLLRCHIRPDLQLIGDPLRLQQILLNLLANAIKFTHQGAISLGVEPVHETPVAVHLQFRVQDSGIGISQAQMNALFQPFSQADISHARKYGGTGLGLALSQRLARAMSGLITVESETGVGSTFTLTIPFEVGTTEAQREIIHACTAAQATWGTQPEEIREIQGARVLLVDDIPLNQEIAQEFLEGYGLIVTRAGSGREAIAQLQAQTFDLLLMDIQMPDMNGIQATQTIRHRWPGRRLPIIAMTAHALADDRQMCLEAGMDDYITKPIDPRQLLHVLGRWIQSGTQATQEATTPQVDQCAPEPLLLPAELPGIHLATALRLVHGNQRVMYHSLAAFRRDYADAPARIERAWQGQQPAEARRLVHTIKGLAGNLGMVDLCALATRLDAALRQDQADRTLFIAFSAEMNRVMEGVDGLGTWHIPSAYPQEGFNLGLFESQCQVLATLLAEGDFTAPDRLPILAETLRGQAAPLFAQLEAQTMAFATTEAIATLKALQQAIRQHHQQPSP